MFQLMRYAGPLVLLWSVSRESSPHPMAAHTVERLGPRPPTPSTWGEEHLDQLS